MKAPIGLHRIKGAAWNPIRYWAAGAGIVAEESDEVGVWNIGPLILDANNRVTRARVLRLGEWPGSSTILLRRSIATR